jgi:CRISPR/Cas system-associated exonuclease Cas4 (RecB family)
MSIVKNAVNLYVENNQKNLGPHDRTTTVGSSEIGQCERRVWFTKAEKTELGSTFQRNPDYVDSWGARLRGDLVENHLFVPAIKAHFGKNALLLGKKQKTFVDGCISATPDCLVLWNDQILIEFKSVDPRVKLDEPKPEHVYQVQVQMGIMHAKSKYRPMYAILAYVNASFMDEITEFQIDYDPDIYARAQVRAMKIMTASSHHELQPEGWIAGAKECEYCPFTDACGRARQEVPKQVIVPADAQFVAEMSDMAKRYATLNNQMTILEEDKRRVQNEIKERLREKGQRKIDGDGVMISWAEVKGRELYDHAAIREVLANYGSDIEEFKREGTPGDRLTVTLKPATMADKVKVA